MEEVLAINNSVQGLMESAVQNQMFRKAKMKSALTASPMPGATAPIIGVNVAAAYAANTSGSVLLVVLAAIPVPLPNSQILPAEILLDITAGTTVILQRFPKTLDGSCIDQWRSWCFSGQYSSERSVSDLPKCGVQPGHGLPAVSAGRKRLTTKGRRPCYGERKPMYDR